MQITCTAAAIDCVDELDDFLKAVMFLCENAALDHSDLATNFLREANRLASLHADSIACLRDYLENRALA